MRFLEYLGFKKETSKIGPIRETLHPHSGNIAPPFGKHCTPCQDTWGCNVSRIKKKNVFEKKEFILHINEK